MCKQHAVGSVIQPANPRLVPWLSGPLLFSVSAAGLGCNHGFATGFCLPQPCIRGRAEEEQEVGTSTSPKMAFRQQTEAIWWTLVCGVVRLPQWGEPGRRRPGLSAAAGWEWGTALWQWLSGVFKVKLSPTPGLATPALGV